MVSFLCKLGIRNKLKINSISFEHILYLDSLPVLSMISSFCFPLYFSVNIFSIFIILYWLFHIDWLLYFDLKVKKYFLQFLFGKISLQKCICFVLFLICNPIKKQQQQQQQPEHKYIPFILLTLHSLNNTYFFSPRNVSDSDSCWVFSSE